MARRRKSRKHGRAKPSLLSVMPLAVPAAYGYLGYKAGGAAGAFDSVLGVTTGMHFYAIGGGAGTGWDPARMLPFVGALGATYVAKKLVTMSRVNAGLKGLPFRL